MISKWTRFNKELHNINRADLKAWMVENLPDEKPSFLFDVVERNALVTEDLLALRAQRDDLLKKVELLKANPQQPSKIGEKAEATYLNIIGGLIGLMLGKTPAGKTQSVFDTQTAIVDALTATYSGKQGISKRTLEEKFAAAKRSIT
jgi:hypothetical protein